MAYQIVSQRYINRLFHTPPRNFKYLDELIHSSDGKVVLKSDIVIDDAEADIYSRGIDFKGDVLHIDGAGHTIDARCMAAIFNFNGKDIRIENTIFKNGHERPNDKEIISNDGMLSLLNCGFLNNVGPVSSEGDMIIRDCVFKGNEEAIGHFDGKLEVCNSIFKDNSGHMGSVIYSDGRVIFTRCAFIGNRAGYLGAIYSEGGEIIIKSCDFKNNSSEGHAGAIDNGEDSYMAIVESRFEKNHAKREGGAIRNEGNLIIRNCEFKNNHSTFGGAIHNTLNLIIQESSFLANISKSNGGAIDNTGGVLEISNSKFSDNRGGIGEAICVSKNDVFKLDGCDLNGDWVGYDEDYAF